MKLQVFSVYDQAVKAYLPPFYCRSKGEAVRSFTEACNDGKSMFAKHRGDYYMVYLGEFDDNGGIFTCENPVRVISALECELADPVTSQTGVAPEARNGSKPVAM